MLGNPAISRAIPLTYDQFRYGFANAVSEEEARALHVADDLDRLGRRSRRP